jgi:hypothetical protein
MCLVADMWDTQSCMQQCLTALIELEDKQLLFDDLPSITRLLPDSIQQLPNYSAWADRCSRCVGKAAVAEEDGQPQLLYSLKDVHALLTSPELLLQFRQLPFDGIKAWMASSDLVVDSEDSVAVAVGWWARGDVGSKCTRDQLKELSGLLRVRHLVTPSKQHVAFSTLYGIQHAHSMWSCFSAFLSLWRTNDAHASSEFCTHPCCSIMMHCSLSLFLLTGICLV